MKNDELIAIIILNYFNAKLTKACCESIRQEIDANFFIVENSADSIERNKLINAIAPFQEQTTILFPDRNLGFAAGVNLGLREAIKRGNNQFLIINNDARLKAGSGQALKKAFYQYKGCLISPKIYWDHKTIGIRYYHKYTGVMFDDVATVLSKYFLKLGFLPYLTGCALAFDKTLITKTGFFDEDFFMYGEDVEFSQRARAKGCELKLLDEVFVEHDGSISAKKRGSFFYEFLINRSHLLLTKKLAPTFLVKNFSYIGKFCYLFIRSLYRTIRFKNFIPIKAFVLSFKHEKLPNNN